MRTPLYESHVKLGARMVDFAGWDMPVYYSSIIAEHKAVRNSSGLFDIGHMGAVEISGPNALPFLQRLLTNDATRLDIGSSQYSIILNTSGGVIDDIFVYRLANRYMLVINASNTLKDIEWIKKNNDEDATISDIKDKMTLVALQGPRSQDILQKICDIDLKKIGHHKIADSIVMGFNVLISRTGYTGEDGFELFFEASNASSLWEKLIGLGAVACGLGARDTLRLEAGLPLYGHEYNEGITPLEAGFSFAVKFDKGPFIGRESLLQHKEEGFSKKLVGLKIKGIGIPRQGYKVIGGRNIVGYITSGTMSPTLNAPIGMGYVKSEYSSPGTILSVEVRGKEFPAEVVKLPFYRPTGRQASD